MSARDEYPKLAIYAGHYAEKFPNGQPGESARALDEIDRLRRWKAEAECVIEEWDQRWEKAGCPGKLGETKSEGTFQLLKQLQDHKARLREELAKHGWGDIHYGSQEQDSEVVKLLEETA